MGRARGSNAKAYGIFESTPGVTPTGSAWFGLPFVSHTLGEERNLIASDLLGQGRELLDPTPDVANNDGDIVVPVDARNFGYWLKLFLGAPATTPSAAATGTLVLSAQPAANSTVTVNGVTVTFVASGATGAQVNIGANAAATAAALQTYLSGVSTGAIAQATYTVSGSTVTITNKTLGPAGNGFTLAASATSNATVSGATLGGGLNSHLFTSGATALPSMSIEVGHPEVPAFSTHYGARGNQLKIQQQRSGLLNATCSLICIGESAFANSSAAASPSPTLLQTARFPQATGYVQKDGAQLGSVVGSNITLSNNLEKVETIQASGRIEDSDPGQYAATGDVTVRFADRTLLDAATGSTPVALGLGWSFGAFSLVLNLPRIFLPRPKRPITGPNGIQAQFNWQASGALAAATTATLINDVAGY